MLAWNRAATAVMTDYSLLPRERRNGLRMMFTEPVARASYRNWEADARFILGIFRADTARAGASRRAGELVAELSRVSPEFRAMWAEGDVHQRAEGGAKRIASPLGGSISLNASVLGIDGQPGISMLVFTSADANTHQRLVELLS